MEFLARAVFLRGEEDVGHAQRPVCKKGLAIVAHFLGLVCNYTELSFKPVLVFLNANFSVPVSLKKKFIAFFER